MSLGLSGRARRGERSSRARGMVRRTAGADFERGLPRFRGAMISLSSVICKMVKKKGGEGIANRYNTSYM